MSDTVAGATGKPEAAGNFHRYPFPKLLFYLYRKQFTGLMSVVEALVEHRLYLRDGLPVAAQIASGEAASELFVQSGWIAPELYRQAEAMARRTQRSISEVLRAMGALTSEQLLLARKQQLLLEMVALFRMPDAQFELYRVDHEHGRTKEDVARLRVHPRRVVLAGVRAAYDRKRLEQEFGPELEVHAFRIDPDAYGALGHYGFAATDKPLLTKLCAGFCSLDQLAAATGRSAEDVAKILYAFKVTGALESRLLDDIPAESPPLVATPVPVDAARPGSYRFTGRTLPADARAEKLTLSGAAAPTPRERRADEDEVRALREKIETLGRRLGEIDHFELLGVPRDATRDQIRAAWLTEARTLDVARVITLGLGALRETVERIHFALAGARDVLVDDDQRRAYTALVDEGGQALAARHEHAQGEAALKQNRLEVAVQHLRRAVELAPRDADAIALLAWTVHRQSPGEHADRVKRELVRASNLAPQSTRPLYLLGEVHLHEGDFARAIVYFQRTLELDERHVDAERGLRLANMRKSKTRPPGLFKR